MKKETELQKIYKIIDHKAKKHMLNWDLESFKRTHPRLMWVIIESMEEYAKDQQ